VPSCEHVSSRRIAYYKCVSLVEDLVRRELGFPEAHTRAADPKLYFAGIGESRRQNSAAPMLSI